MAADMYQSFVDGPPRLPLGAVEQTASMQAVRDREHAIEVILRARQGIREIRALLDTCDKHLSDRLFAYQVELDTRLGQLLICREDQR